MPPTPPVTLRTDSLTKHYGPVEALVDLNLEIHAGEVFGFLGPNGAGKTTAIRTILDEIRPTSGSASILGLDCHRDSVEIRRHVGYVPGELAMYPQLTGRDLLRYFAHLRGGVDWDHVDALAERLAADLSVKIGNLSSGNRQKVGLIQAFMNRPEVLIMDEPSTGLDPLVQREFQTMMRELAAEGRTVFLSSHTLSEVQRVADRVGIIRRGRLIALESVSELRTKGLREVRFQFPHPVPPTAFDAIAGVRHAEVTNAHAVVSFEGQMAELLKVAVDYEATDVSSEEADLEEIFLAYYRGDEVQA
jgi:ABC-2 type transport system ATP-binding protein